MYLISVYCKYRSYIRMPECWKYNICKAVQCSFSQNKTIECWSLISHAGNDEKATWAYWSFARGSTLLGSVPWQYIWGCTSTAQICGKLLLTVSFLRVISMVSNVCSLNASRSLIHTCVKKNHSTSAGCPEAIHPWSWYEIRSCSGMGIWTCFQ